MPETREPVVADAIDALSSSKLAACERCPERCRRLYCRGPREHVHSVYQAAGAVLGGRAKRWLAERLDLPCPSLKELTGWVSRLNVRGWSLGGQLWEGHRRTGGLKALAREVTAVEPTRLLPGAEPDPKDAHGSGWRVRGELEGRPLTMRPDVLGLSGLPGPWIGISLGPAMTHNTIQSRSPLEAARLQFDTVLDLKTAGVVRGASGHPLYLRRWKGGVDVGMHPDLAARAREAAVDREGRPVPAGARDPYSLLAIEELPPEWALQLGLYALGLGVRRVGIDLVYARPGWRAVECVQYRAHLTGRFEDELRARVRRFWAWADATPAAEPAEARPGRETCWAYNSLCEVGEDCAARLEAGL